MTYINKELLARLCVFCMALALTACDGSSTSPDERGLRAGRYRVTFTVPMSTTTPGALIGTHDFTFRVTDPADDESFSLMSSTRTSTTFGGDPLPPTPNYLSTSNQGVIAGAEQWRVQWYLAGQPTLAVRVTMLEADGDFTLPFGCRAVRSETENYDGANCQVVYLGEA